MFHKNKLEIKSKKFHSAAQYVELGVLKSRSMAVSFF